MIYLTSNLKWCEKWDFSHLKEKMLWDVFYAMEPSIHQISKEYPLALKNHYCFPSKLLWQSNHVFFTVIGVKSITLTWFSVLWGFVMCFHEKAELYLYFRESYWQFRKISQMAAVTTKVTHFLKKNMHSPSYVLQWSVNEIFKPYLQEGKKYHIFCQ